MNTRLEDYAEIVRPIEDRIIRAVWRVVQDPHDAEDAMQDALTTIWTRWDRVRAHAHPQALILKICLDAAYDVVRRRARLARPLPEPDQTTVARDHDPTNAVSSEEQRAKIIRAIGQLSRHQAAATLMRLVEEQSYDDIAAALGCTPATARRHVARGRSRLRHSLADLCPNN